MDAQTRQRYMQAMGIPVWTPRSAVAEIEPAPKLEILPPVLEETKPITPARNTPEPPVSELIDCSNMSWNELQASVQVCQQCDLAKTRTQTVFGTGDAQADWLIVGEAPGAEEDRRGEPFVGKAGQLLTNMLAAIGLPREAVFIMNVLKCRPPNNRDPKPEEANACRAYLQRQIELLQPKVIMVVGRVAAQNLLKTDLPLGRMRGRVHQLPDTNIPVVVTYHPAYLLRKPSEKRKAWQDLLMAQQFKS